MRLIRVVAKAFCEDMHHRPPAVKRRIDLHGPNGLGQWVYFIRAENGGPVKIGTTCNVDSRLRAMQCGAPGKLTVLAAIPGSYRVEKALHERFSSDRLHGEWFRLSGRVRRFISGLKTTRHDLA